LWAATVLIDETVLASRAKFESFKKMTYIDMDQLDFALCRNNKRMKLFARRERRRCAYRKFDQIDIAGA
jgi:hypothetical protein